MTLHGFERVVGGAFAYPVFAHSGSDTGKGSGLFVACLGLVNRAAQSQA